AIDGSSHCSRRRSSDRVLLPTFVNGRFDLVRGDRSPLKPDRGRQWRGRARGDEPDMDQGDRFLRNRAAIALRLILEACMQVVGQVLDDERAHWDGWAVPGLYLLI